MRREAIGTVVAVLATAAIGVATLTPLPPISLEYCARCRGMNVADVVANVILFTPLGIGMALRGVGWRGTVAIGALLSAAVEGMQIGIVPGRDATPVDFVTNAVGAAAGWWIASSARRWLCPSAAVARRLSLGIAAAAALTFVATGWLLAPAPPDAGLYAQWTPDLGYLARYEGRVLDARIGGYPAPDGRFADSVPVRELLLDGAEIHVRGIVGPPVDRLAALFNIFDEHRTEVVVLGPDRDDLVLAVRRRAYGARLDNPALRVPGAMAGLAPGSPLDVRITRSGAETCIAVNAASTCGLGFTIGIGWAFINSPDHLPPFVKTLFDLSWVAGWAFLAGFWARRRWVAIAAALAVVAAAAAAPVAGLLPTPAALFLAGIAGFAVGCASGWAAERRLAPAHRR